MLALLLAAGLGAGLAIAQAHRESPATAVAARDPGASEQTLPSAGPTATEQLSLIRSAAQRKDYPDVIVLAQRYVKAGGAETDVRSLLAQAHYELHDYANAARELQWEIQAAERGGAPPREDRLLMLQSCYAKLNDTNAYAWGLEKLVTYYPKREYWADLLDRTQKRPDFGERLSLDVNRLRLLTGTLGSATDFVAMANQARQAGFPAEARRVVDHGFARGVLGTGADAARHRELQRQLADETLAQRRQVVKQDVEAAAERASDGIELFNLGWIHSTLGDHTKGLALMEQGIRKGGLANRPQDAALRLGIGYLMAGQKAKAIDTFRKVGGRHGAADLARIWGLYARNTEPLTPPPRPGS
jgi:hypothetical protein